MVLRLGRRIGHEEANQGHKGKPRYTAWPQRTQRAQSSLRHDCGSNTKRLTKDTKVSHGTRPGHKGRRGPKVRYDTTAARTRRG